MDKQEKIKEAYNGLGLPFNENILFDNGWLKIKPTQYQSKYNDVDLLKLTNHVHSIRPKSLSGIENNNGWIKIETEEDLPNKPDELFEVGILDSIGYFHHEIKRYAGKSLKWMWNKDLITHYQPIEKPKPPLY